MEKQFFSRGHVSFSRAAGGDPVKDDGLTQQEPGQREKGAERESGAVCEWYLMSCDDEAGREQQREA